MASIGYDRTYDTGRGREASAPQQIPAAGWKDVLLRTFGSVNDDRVMLVAAGVTYFLLLAIFPAVTAFVSVYGLFVDPASLAKQLSVLANVVPAGGLDIIRDQLARVTAHGAPTLGLTLAVSLIVALWSASSGVKSLFEAMNIAYDEREKRNFFVLNGVALLFTLAGILGGGIMLAVVVALPAVLAILGLGKGMEWLVQIVGYLVMLGVLLTGIAALYRFGPSRQQAKWRWITPGAILAVVVIGVVSMLFSWYAANLGHFDQTYGSLGALIGFLFWMWVSITALIVGAELNSELELQTVRDSTTRNGAPLGQRGATVADAVAPSEAETRATVGAPSDPFADRSAEWIAGYNAALKRRPGGARPLPMTAAVPALLLLGLLGRRASPH